MRTAQHIVQIRRWCVVLLVLALAGCRAEPEPEDESPPEAVEETEDVEEQPKPPETAFGVPLPPEYEDVRRGENQIRVATYMSLDELQEFFEGEAIDYEVLRPEGRLQLLPLRSGLATVSARPFGGRNSHIVVNYRSTPDAEELGYKPLPPPSSDEDSDADGDDAAPQQIARLNIDRRQFSSSSEGLPAWVEQRKGEPVELRGEDGELIAPGARWGEPYFPPEGSHLHKQRYEHLFGAPYGAW